MRISCRGLGASGLGRKLPTHEPLVGAGRFGARAVIIEIDKNGKIQAFTYWEKDS